MPAFDTLQMGITTRCNLLCAHCPREPADCFEHLPLELFKQRLARFEAARFGTLLVSDFGEPTMVPGFLSYLRHARRQGWRAVEFVTNASCTDRALWEAVVREELAARIMISLEAATPAQYRAFRGQPWETFARTVALITALKGRHAPGAAPEIRLNAVCLVDTLHELEPLIRFTAEVGADALSLVHLNPTARCSRDDWRGGPDHHLDGLPRDRLLEAFAHALALARDLGVDVSLPEPMPELGEAAPWVPPPAAAPDGIRCTQPFLWVQVHAGGAVYPCCQMSARWSVGNLDEADFEQL